MRNDKFRPDLELLTNPPYPDFCKNLLYFYVRSFSLHLKKESLETIGDRYSQFSEQKHL